MVSIIVASRTPFVTERAVAFRELTDQHLDSAYRLAAVILGDRFEAEDAVHDAALTAWRRWHQLRDPQRFEPWFDRILVNGCRDRLRARRRHRVVQLDVYAPEADQTTARGSGDALERTRLRVALDRTLAELEPDHAVVIVLRFYLDLAVADIAVRLGIPEGTVKSRLHSGLGRLRAALDREDLR